MTGALGQLEGDLRIHWPMHAAAMCSSCSLLLKYYCASLILLNFSAAALCCEVPLVDFTMSTRCNFCHSTCYPSQMASENNEFVCRTSRHNCSASYSFCIEFRPPARKPWGSFLWQKYLQHFEMLSATLKASLGFLKLKLRSISFNLYTFQVVPSLCDG